MATHLEVSSSHRCAPAAGAGSGQDTQPLRSHCQQSEARMQTCEGKGLGNFVQVLCLGADKRLGLSK